MTMPRRDFFRRMSGGCGGSHLSPGARRFVRPGADATARRSAAASVARAPRATSVIHLFMNGGPSQMDLFDPKPELDRHHGRSYFDRIAGEVENPQSAGR